MMVITVVTLAACSSSGAATSDPTVPSLAGGASRANVASPRPSGAGQLSGKDNGPPSGHDYSVARVAALHNAAACIRAHGVPGYTDPVLTPSGATYSDRRPFEEASAATRAAVTHACGTLMAQASLNPDYEPPAPPQLVQAGVASARCMRAHGMPNLRDPSPQTPYTPGHGFGLAADEIPAGGKQSPVFRHAIQACQQVNAAEIRDSTLASLSNDG